MKRRLCLAPVQRRHFLFPSELVWFRVPSWSQLGIVPPHHPILVAPLAEAQSEPEQGEEE